MRTDLGVVPAPELTSGALGAVPMVVGLWPVLLTGIYAMNKRKEKVAADEKAQAVAATLADAEEKAASRLQEAMDKAKQEKEAAVEKAVKEALEADAKARAEAAAADQPTDDEASPDAEEPEKDS
jgi:hypothetical protein